jgi:osmoprotectant transport system ATP-binding protein
VLRAGRVLQYDTPSRLLAQPVDAFVESFVGSDRALRRLSLLRSGTCARSMELPASARRIDVDTPLRDALSLLLESEGALAVVDGKNRVVGGVSLEAIRAALSAPPADQA